MKNKTKIVAIAEIAIVLCSLFLVALPAIAAEQNQEMQEVSANAISTTSEDAFVLGVYGNANEDDTIDMRDLTYVKLIFFGKKPETELADAKYDGKINPLDFIQIKLIIVGKEKELTIVDSADRIVTVKKPVERIVSINSNVLETMRSLKLGKDKIVGVSTSVKKDNIFFPEFSEYPTVGTITSPDIEKMLELRPNAVFLYASIWHSQIDEIQNKLEAADPSIAVIDLNCYRPGDIYVEEVKKLGYILGKRKEANEFVDFYDGVMSTIKEKVEVMPKEEKPRVYFESSKPYSTAGKGAGYHQKLVMAGGNNIFSDLSGYKTVDPEEVIKRDPEIIVRNEWPTSAGGYGTDDITKMRIVRGDIMDRPELTDVTAVKEESVYIVSNDIYGGSRHFIGITYMAKWFHPDLFEDLDPKAIHQEFLTRFQGLDYDLDKHGVFVYHPEEHPDGK